MIKNLTAGDLWEGSGGEIFFCFWTQINTVMIPTVH